MPFVNSVFLSATFGDLKKEREVAIGEFIDVGILPFSMELFPAHYRDKQEYIKDLIWEADYFALIIGGRYGEYLDPVKKLSFTEWEYDTAVQCQKKIIAFIPADIDAIPGNKTDCDEEKKNRLKSFIKKVEAVPLVSRYDYGNLASLQAAVSKAFSSYGYAKKTISRYCGKWISKINKIDNGNEHYPNKSDEWIFYGRGQYVYGTIRRLQPKKDERTWSFVGMEFGDQLMISFSEDDKTKRSAGILIMKKAYNVDNKMKGFYYELSKPDGNNNYPLAVPIILTRKKTQ